MGQKAGPGGSSVALKMDLKQGDKTIASEKFSSYTTTDMLRGKNNVKELRRNFLIGMVELVSFAFEECIENAVYTINAQINAPN